MQTSVASELDSDDIIVYSIVLIWIVITDMTQAHMGMDLINFELQHDVCKHHWSQN